MKAILQIYLLIFSCSMLTFTAQINYQFRVSTLVTECEKGSASIVGDTQPGDTVTINWSTGQTGFTSIKDLDEGNYSVHIDVKNKFDTTIYFKIDKVFCRVGVAAYFTPNGDNYNDFLSVSHTEDYPNFEFEIYNKWGQRIHQQKSTYVPWDGTWAGLHVPDGTYYYLFFYDSSNKNLLIKGSITILR